jgi:hypothetical protein
LDTKTRSASIRHSMCSQSFPPIPTFAIFEYFADHAANPAAAKAKHELLDYHLRQFKKQIAAGIPFAVGSDAKNRVLDTDPLRARSDCGDMAIFGTYLKGGSSRSRSITCDLAGVSALLSRPPIFEQFVAWICGANRFIS